MIKKYICKFCKNKTIRISSLRFLFYKCEICNNIYRSRLNKFNIFNYLNKTPFAKLSNNYKNKKNQYEWYTNFERKSYKDDKYFFLTKFLRRKKIKKVLDISGGPGLTGLEIKKKYNLNYEITEYNNKISKHIKKITGLSTYILDFDNLKKNKVPNKKYDLILLWYSIYFCRDIFQLVDFLKKRIKKNGYLVISQNVPNFAALTKFSIMEPYSPYVLYDHKFLIKKFEKNEFIFFDLKFFEEKFFIKRYFFKSRSFYNFIYNIICILISLYYITINYLKINFENLFLKDYLLIFKKIK
tara:strand:+ start:1569 stop:2462 length:894 start_codon:yes stop_codon:yes gene_type:complete